MSSKSIMHASLASLRRGVSSFCRLSLPTRAVVCAAVGATTAVGCGWFGPSETVRFSGGYGEPNERLYSRLPMLSVGGDDSFTKREETEDWEDYEAEERNAREIAALWVKATDVSQAVGREGLERVRGDLREYLKESEPQGLDDNGRNTAIDLLDAFTALDKGSSPAAAQAYMKARQAYDAWLAAIHPEPVYVYPKPPARSDAEIAAENSEKLDALRHAIEEIPADRNLSDNVAYLRAAITYQEANYEDAAREFQSLTLHYPRSEKREASLLMEGLAQLKQSSSYKADDASALSSAPCAECRDDAWKAARAAFGRVIGEYPRGRYGRDARGWLAFTSLRVGDTGAGLAEYYRLLADESDVGERAEALNSLDMARFHADEAAMHKVEAELSNEPDAALAYAYHEIYNYVAGLNIYEAPVYERDEKQEHSTSSSDYVQRNKEAKRRLSDWRRKELRRVVEFAAVMLRRYPRTKVGGEFALRLAEANFESDDARAARDNAVRALGAGLVGARRVEALWVKGVAEYRLREYDAARRTLKTLLDEDPRGELSAGGRRLVAMIAEDAGDLDAALEQYLALDYKEDAAYFVDVLMTPEQLASFVERYPDLPQRDELLYALGVRYLRDNRFTEARAAYARVHTTRAEDSSCSYAYGCHANSRFGAASYEDESP
ncbi:MAG: Outer rane lipoprotein, partial [Acidobacteriota bacterium]|nr:Outer rane lipoprotein [Acidobacteriota bacterium]